MTTLFPSVTQHESFCSANVTRAAKPNDPTSTDLDIADSFDDMGLPAARKRRSSYEQSLAVSVPTELDAPGSMRRGPRPRLSHA